jgi:hypothetical protein
MGVSRSSSYSHRGQTKSRRSRSVDAGVIWASHRGHRQRGHGGLSIFKDPIIRSVFSLTGPPKKLVIQSYGGYGSVVILSAG